MVKPVRAKKASFAIVVLWGQEASKGHGGIRPYSHDGEAHEGQESQHCHYGSMGPGSQQGGMVAYGHKASRDPAIGCMSPGSQQEAMYPESQHKAIKPAGIQPLGA